MTIALEDSSTQQTTSSSFTATPSSTPTDGNLLLAGVVVGTGETVSAAPSGWTLVGSRQEGNGKVTAYLYSKVASGESGSYTWTLSSSVPNVCGYMEWSNVNTLDIDDSVSSSGDQPTSATLSLASNANDETLIVHVAAYDPDASISVGWSHATQLVGGTSTGGEVAHENNFNPPGTRADGNRLDSSVSYAIVSAGFYYDPGISSVILRRRRMR